jgi:hypothetical protein
LFPAAAGPDQAGPARRKIHVLRFPLSDIDVGHDLSMPGRARMEVDNSKGSATSSALVAGCFALVAALVAGAASVGTVVWEFNKQEEDQHVVDLKTACVSYAQSLGSVQERLRVINYDIIYNDPEKSLRRDFNTLDDLEAAGGTASYALLILNTNNPETIAATQATIDARKTWYVELLRYVKGNHHKRPEPKTFKQEIINASAGLREARARLLKACMHEN